MTGEPILLVALDSDAGAPSAEAIAAAEAGLAALPCPAVALDTGSPGSTATPLRDHFDIVVRSREELEPILSATRRTPLAAMALVQLLRQSAHLDIHQGLVAESLVYSTLQSGPEFGELVVGATRSTRARAGAWSRPFSCVDPAPASSSR